MGKQYWLVKQEPEDYSWSDFVKDGSAQWTGVRNYAARNNLRAMKTGDDVLFYHSGDEKTVVGLARVRRAAFPDPTAGEGDWVAVELELRRPMTLAEIKAEPGLRDIALVRNSRLSVMPLKPAEFKIIAGS
jgi:predicted RNA-binding protein with PUA-like domain